MQELRDQLAVHEAAISVAEVEIDQTLLDLQQIAQEYTDTIFRLQAAKDKLKEAERQRELFLHQNLLVQAPARAEILNIERLPRPRSERPSVMQLEFDPPRGHSVVHNFDTMPKAQFPDPWINFQELAPPPNHHPGAGYPYPTEDEDK